jgi:hypothetical protein
VGMRGGRGSDHGGDEGHHTSLCVDLVRWKRARWNQLWVCMKDIQLSQ